MTDDNRFSSDIGATIKTLCIQLEIAAFECRLFEGVFDDCNAYIEYRKKAIESIDKKLHARWQLIDCAKKTRDRRLRSVILKSYQIDMIADSNADGWIAHLGLDRARREYLDGKIVYTPMSDII